MQGPLILDRLLDYSSRDVVSFHVPGHKNGRILDQYNYRNFKEKLSSIDTTEIPGTDNLHDPEEMIKEAQERAARFFGADHTYFLVNGTSCGNMAMLMTVGNPGDKIIIPRDCHKSVSYGLIMGGLIPVYVNPEIHDDYYMPMGIQSKTIEKALVEHPDAKAVLITYPNYYGICSDIVEIARIVHQYGKILLVDEAHGAHLNLSDTLPISALEAGADMVVQSIHKTLPSFTQSSMLHVKSDRIDQERLRFMLSMHQSSSPSYLLMMSLDLARAIVEQDGRHLMSQLLDHIDYFHEKAREMEGLHMFDERLTGRFGVKSLDRTKLVIDMSALGISGVLLEKLLRTKHHIQVEMCSTKNVVAVASIGNTKDDFDRLLNALKEIGDGKGFNRRKVEIPLYSYHIPSMRITPREAVYSPKIERLFKESEGSICGEYVIPYPPGIPILCPGEEITADLIEYINALLENGINLIGPKDATLEKIQVIG
ncbi:MAG: aminotransferase class I/II-fold pyridoxal phosphate-dependent enzyme [Bacillota bacterium]